MKKIYVILICILLLFIGYYSWSNANRINYNEQIFPRFTIAKIENIGNNNGKGNIIALSPFVNPYHFSSEEAFSKMLHYHFNFAKQQKILNDSTIVVLPEYIGTWLVVANEKKSIYSDTSLENAMKTIVLSNILTFGETYFTTSAKDKTSATIFKMKAHKMLEIFQNTFSALAKEFKVTIVAGSIVLPDPSVKNGKIEINSSGKLYNITAVFDNKGNVLAPLTQKIFPINEEQMFTCAANQKNSPIYKVPSGNLAVLICADSWYPENYELLKDKNINVLAVPSFVSGNNSWNNKWKGYNGAPMPKDVDKNDIGQISEYEAWLKYAMVGRAQKSNINSSVNVFLRGNLWNLGTDGNTLVSTSKELKAEQTPSFYEAKNKQDKTSTFVNLWLE